MAPTICTDNFWWGSIMQLYNAFPPDPEIVGDEHWRAIWKEIWICPLIS